MTVLVCEGTETPESHGCVYQTSLQPVAVRVVGDSVFGEISPGQFAVVALMVFGLVAYTRALSILVRLFRLRKL